MRVFTREIVLLVVSCLVLVCTLSLQGCTVTETPEDEGMSPEDEVMLSPDGGMSPEDAGDASDVSECVPRTVCGQKQCGTAPDGCGGELDCGPCACEVNAPGAPCGPCGLGRLVCDDDVGECVVDEQLVGVQCEQVLWADADASERGDGTSAENPSADLQGLLRARPTVVVATGRFEGPIELVEGVHLVGASDEIFEIAARDGEADTDLVAVVAEEIAEPTLLKSVLVRSGAAPVERSSVGLRAIQAPGLVVRNSRIVSGEGGAGRAGERGRAGQSGQPGKNGREGNDGFGGPFALGGAGCGNDSKARGGNGGFGEGGWAGGGDGADALIAQGGRAHAKLPYRAAENGEDAPVVSDGTVGTSGREGRVGLNNGRLTHPDGAGEAGQSGEDGTGGGGGGGTLINAACQGVGGAGGGGGGCGGTGGKGASAGGHSVGVLVVDSDGLLIEETVVEAAVGGRGGAGGQGGRGGLGGRGGKGTKSCSGLVNPHRSGDGGNGAAGGAGGDGGAGAGGHSYGLLCLDSIQVSTINSRVTAGQPGPAGPGADEGRAQDIACP